MPYYDYVCLDCEIKFERNVPVDDRDTIKCPECGEHAVRQFNTPAFKIPQERIRKYRGQDGVKPSNVEEYVPRKE